MQTPYAAPTEVSPLILPTALVTVVLFCLFGLAISLIVIPHIPAEDLGWIIAHLE